MGRFLFTSESVTEGHPDKICDRVSDAILDAIIEQDPNGHVACETAITASTVAQLNKDLIVKVICSVIPSDMLDNKTKIYINPTGRFVIGGPQGDSGLTGRKIMVDTYGGYARHGGGAFSGKDPTKVDRSAAYAARYVAKNIVASGLAKKCEVQIAYAIGIANPVSIMVDTFGTGKYSDSDIVKAVKKVFDLRPTAIINNLNLKKPIYKQLAAYGHVGRENIGVKWEEKDKISKLLQYFNDLNEYTNYKLETHCDYFKDKS